MNERPGYRRCAQPSWLHIAAQWGFVQQPPVPLVPSVACWSSLSVALDSGAPAAAHYEAASPRQLPDPLSPERNQSHAQPRGASRSGGTSLHHHAHGSPEAEQDRGRGSPTPSFLTGVCRPTRHCLPPTLVFARIPVNSQNCVAFPWGLGGGDLQFPFLCPGEEGSPALKMRQFNTDHKMKSKSF